MEGDRMGDDGMEGNLMKDNRIYGGQLEDD